MPKVELKQVISLIYKNLEIIFTPFFKSNGYEIKHSCSMEKYVRIKKSTWIIAKLKQKADSISLKIVGYALLVAVWLLLYGIVSILILLTKWRELENEAKDFVLTAELTVN